MASQKPDSRLNVDWNSNGRYRGVSVDPARGASRPSSEDGSEELQPGERGSNGRMSRRSSWSRIDLVALAIASLLAVAAFVETKRPQDAVMLLAAGWLVLKITLEVGAFFFRHLVLCLTGATVVTLGGGLAVVDNPHCLKPVTSGNEGETAVCLLVSTFAPGLARMVDVEWQQMPVDSTGQLRRPPSPGGAKPASLLRLPSERLDYPQRRWTTGWLSSAWAASSRDDSSDEAGVQIDVSEKQRFNLCVSSLYEDPALKYKAWAILQRGLDTQDAHDVVMKSLMGVCERYMSTQIDDLVPYFVRSVRNGVADVYRHKGQSLRCDLESLQGPRCFEDHTVLLRGEVIWLRRALCSLKPTERLVIEQWEEGGSWAEVGHALGLTAGQAANRFNNAVGKLKRRINDQRCNRIEY